jgi:aspartate kinase
MPVRIIVQKFGGTSVATPEARQYVVKHVRRAISEGFSPVLVVSAMGRKGDPYATDTLIGLARSVLETVNPQELDLIQSCGEIIAAVVMAQSLAAAGLSARAFTGGQAGIVTDASFTNARIIEVRPDAVKACLEKGVVAIVAGFQGVTRDGEITTLGRGGSDTTAAALGVALNAEYIDIFTDVGGVMTADPRLAPDAQILGDMTYSEICEMAHMGAKVVHPRAVEISMEGQIPLRVRSTFDDSTGTLISESRPRPTAAGKEILSDRVVTGIAHVADVSLFKIESAHDVNSSGLALNVFQALAQAGVSVDLIHVSPDQISFIIQTSSHDRALEILRKIVPEITASKGYAKVSAVGAGMRGVPGVMARVVQALSQAHIPIYQTTDSHTNISCLVAEKDLQRAVWALHDEFGLNKRQ